VTSVWTFLIAFVSISAGIVLGLTLRELIPASHLGKDTKEIVRLGAGFVTTLAAVLISLMIASAKSSYDVQDGHFWKMAAYLVETDQLLARYGPEAAPLRKMMRQVVPAAIDRIWREERTASQNTAFTEGSLAEQLGVAIEQLSPTNDTQRLLKRRLEETSAEIARTRLLMFADSDKPIQTPFLLILVFWLAVIFAGFSLFMEPGPVVVSALLVFALSVSSALFLVADLSQPYAGLMQIPKAQLEHTLPPLD
jgi:hypothetical protein